MRISLCFVGCFCALWSFAAACGGDATTAAPTGQGASGSSTSTSTSTSTSSGSSSSGGAQGGSGGGTSSPPTCTAKGGNPGFYDLTLTSSGDERSYRVHIPNGYMATTAMPVIIALHGYTESIDSFTQVTHYEEAADKHQFISVFPAGKAPLGVPGWNAGSCCGTAQIQGTPDVQFISDLIDRLEQDYCIDTKRIFVSGFSNGGMLSHRLACELSDRIAAIGAVSGTMAIDDCKPTRPVPVLHIHGTGDIVVGYDPGTVAQSVPSTINGWVGRNLCGMATSMPYMQGSVQCERHLGCAEGADVELCTVDGGAHEWPGGGTANGMGDLNATEYIVNFLMAHPMP